MTSNPTDRDNNDRTSEARQPPTDPSRRQALIGLAGLGGAAFTSFTAMAGVASRAAAQEGAIVQTAKFNIGAGKEDEAVAMLQKLVAAVQANEPGVLSYQCHRSNKEPSVVFFYEVYADAAALAAHSQQPHMAALRDAFQSGVLAPPVEIVRLDKVAGFNR